MKKNVKKSIQKNKKPILIAGIAAGAATIALSLGKALKSMKASAKADAKESWDDAHMSPAEREEQMQKERDMKIAEANACLEAANARFEAAKK